MLIRKHMVYVDEKTIRSIKTGNTETTPEDEILQELERKKDEILKKAREEAKKILAEAEKKARGILKDADDKAKSLIEESRERIEAELKEHEKMKENLLRMLKSLKDEVRRAADELADRTLPILKIVMRKILEKEIDDELALRRLRSAFERIMGLENVVVRVSPADVDLIKREVEKAGYRLIVDDNLKRGDVVIETEAGVLNKSTSFQMKVIEDAINEVM